MYKHMIKNKKAGKDFFNGSLIFKCIAMEPSSNKARPNAEGCLRTGYQIAAKRPKANITFKVPIT